VDARCSPEWILAAHLADQIPSVSGNWRPSGLAMTDLPGPEQAETFGNHRPRLDDDKGEAPISPSPGQPCPQKAIRGGQFWPLHRTPEDAELVPKSEVLQMDGGSGFEGCRHGGGQHVKGTERRMEELTEYGQAPMFSCSSRFAIGTGEEFLAVLPPAAQSLCRTAETRRQPRPGGHRRPAVPRNLADPCRPCPIPGGLTAPLGSHLRCRGLAAIQVQC